MVAMIVGSIVFAYIGILAVSVCKGLLADRAAKLQRIKELERQERLKLPKNM